MPTLSIFADLSSGARGPCAGPPAVPVRRRPWRWCHAVLVVMLTASCRRPLQPKTGLEASVIVPRSAAAGDSVTLGFTLHNSTRAPIRISVGVGPAGMPDFIIELLALRGDSVVWRYPNLPTQDSRFTPMIVLGSYDTTLAAGAALTRAVRWNLRDRTGRTLPPGSYDVYGYVLVGRDSVRAPRVRLRVAPPVRTTR